MTFCHFKHFCACAHYSGLYIKNFQTNPNQKSFSQLIHIVFYGIGKKLQHVLKENFLYSVAWIFALGNQANFLFEPYWNFFALPRILFNRKTFFNTRALTVLKQKIPTQIPNHTYHFLYHSTKKKTFRAFSHHTCGLLLFPQGMFVCAQFGGDKRRVEAPDLGTLFVWGLLTSDHVWW
jgi:hypothetical protein